MSDSLELKTSKYRVKQAYRMADAGHGVMR